MQLCSLWIYDHVLRILLLSTSLSIGVYVSPNKESQCECLEFGLHLSVPPRHRSVSTTKAAEYWYLGLLAGAESLSTL